MENNNVNFATFLKQYPDKNGYFGRYGGAYLPDELVPAFNEINDAYQTICKSSKFIQELRRIRKEFQGRPTPVYHCDRLSKSVGKCQIYLKREDLNHTGSHKINNVLGQILLAKKMGKKRVIAETGAGQHGVATAAACAKLGMQCVIYQGEVDVRRQQPNVASMELYGAKVVAVKTGSRTLKDAVNEAMRDWATNFETTHYCLGSALGPAPFPDMVRTFQSIIGEEVKKQCAERNIQIDSLVACVGGGSNASGFFAPFFKDEKIKLYGAEGGGTGPEIGNNASRMVGTSARDGIMQGFKSRFLVDDDGQAQKTSSISAGLDYLGISPQLAMLGKTGRITFEAIRDNEALEAVNFFAKNEGILMALESSHAAAYAMKLAPKVPKDKAIIINMSGRGDKDVFITSPVFRPEEWKEFLKSELKRLEENKDVHEKY